MTSVLNLARITIDFPQKVNCVCLTKKQEMIIGTTIGELMLFEIKKENNTLNATLKTKVIHNKKKIEKITIFCGNLLVFCQKTLTYVSLTNFEPICVLGQPKKVESFLIDQKNESMIFMKSGSEFSVLEWDNKDKQFNLLKNLILVPFIDAVWYGDTLIFKPKSQALQRISIQKPNITDLGISGDLKLLSIGSKKFLVVSKTKTITSYELTHKSKKEVQFGSFPNILIYFKPYIVCVNSQTISIHTTYNFEEVQVTNFAGAEFICHNSKKILILKSQECYFFEPVSNNKIITQMVDNKQYTQAIEFYITNYHKSSKSYQQKLNKLHNKIGFRCLKDLKFGIAFESFKQGSINAIELIDMDDEFRLVNEQKLLNPLSSKGIRIQNILESSQFLEKKKTNEYFHEQEVKRYRYFLMIYLEKRKNENIDEKEQIEIDSTLIKLYALFKENSKFDQIIKSKNKGNFDSIEKFLTKNNLIIQLCKFYSQNNNIEKSLKIISQLIQQEKEKGKGKLKEKENAKENEIKNENEKEIEIENEKKNEKEIENSIGNEGEKDLKKKEKGLTKKEMLLIELLKENIQDEALIFTYSRKILETIPKFAIKIFFQKRDPPLDPNEVCEFLETIDQKLKIKYLEYLVNIQETQIGKYHTQLAKYYIKKIQKESTLNNLETSIMSQNISEYGMIKKITKKLKELIKQSEYYDSQSILDEIGDSPLWEIKVQLLKRLERHRDALSLLVYRIEVPELIYQYCDSIPQEKQEPIILDLLYVTLHPINKCMVRLGETILYLRKYSKKLNPLKVLNLIGDNGLLSTFKEFLNISISRSIHKSSGKLIDLNFKKNNLLHLKKKLSVINSQYFVLDEKVNCKFCDQKIGNVVFIRNADGNLFHHECFKKFQLSKSVVQTKNVLEK
ncbi:cnh domain containing [Anaeramoeba flamelloides]|uniref:Cnh domain containing n=1 Tax=Anaeramoeba flamelloides TaxID=1746091 RepID=A0ABQ8X1V0_9EUKA|nr:cnh domain containing [Anaeramoeba flamelloides]